MYGICSIDTSPTLQVKVRDIHVRYEDGVTNPDQLLAAGITLHSLELKVHYGVCAVPTY